MGKEAVKVKVYSQGGNNISVPGFAKKIVGDTFTSICFSMSFDAFFLFAPNEVFDVDSGSSWNKT